MTSDTREPHLDFERFSFQYRSQSAPTLKNICLSVRKGEKILIVGPSGSGKTTLAHCINGLIPHSFPGTVSGTYTLDGKDALDLGVFGISKKIGTVLQDPDGQFVGLSAGEDIAFVLENDCVAQDSMRSRVTSAAELVGIEKHLDKSPQDLSGGQKQRVAMAGILVDDVDVLLFDEPLANLDPATGRKAIALIDRIHRETGKTVIIVEHRLEDALCEPVDRIVLMEDGRIVADLPPEEMLATDLLRNAGIREPLYLVALRHAGVSFSAADRPESVGEIRFDPAAVREWAEAHAEEKRAEGGKPFLEFEYVSFAYDDGAKKTSALENVSFVVREGECASLVGRNGAGKSTLAKLACGFETPDTGRILLAGNDLAGRSIASRAELIGFVMQNPNQMISLPMVFDEVTLGLRSRGINETETAERAEAALDTCGLYPFRKWPVSALSFGQKKRLTIAAILALGPKLLIMDEPTAGQDFRHYTEIMEFLRKLNRERGQTLLLITHDMHLMLEYTTRAIVVADGRLVADATPAEILTNDTVIEAASLKRTTLYDLAVRSGAGDPRSFVQRFIDFDRKERER